MKRFLPFVLITTFSILFFWQFLVKGFLPVPADTIVGLYHPYRDFYAKNYPRGIPFKNFLITDPVRQQYPWRNLSIELFKNKELPLWNPYSFVGTPLLANLQSAVFYPFNILFFFLPFHIAWSFLIFLGVILAGLFMYLYLRNLRLNNWACILGAITFSFSGFSIAWLEWGTILHTALWTPLILLSIDKVLAGFKENLKLQFKIKQSLRVMALKNYLVWAFIFTFSLISSFFAGHLQTFFYLFILSFIYLLVRLIKYGTVKILPLFAICYLLFAIITAIQWLPTFQFLLESSRTFDQNFQKEGWFIPWQNLIQFIAPDFFGNPSTLNYWGVFNYAEFVGYVGIIPIIFATFALFFRRDKKTLFYGTIFFLSLIFALPTIFAKIPFILNIPFVSTAQPTRLLFLTDFTLSILTALGFDFYIRRKKGMTYILLFFTVILFFLWAFTILGKNLYSVSLDNLEVAKRNLILPTSLLIVSSIIVFSFHFFSKNKRLLMPLYSLVFIVVLFDLFRFGWKFIPFTNKDYLYPQTKILSFLKQDKTQFRIMTTDPRIFPPNFSVIYKLQSLDGYDPLYLTRYAQLMAASERGEPNINPPFGFNRIINPKDFSSKIIDLLGVKYVLSLSDLESDKLEKVFVEGETRVYENKNVFPRTFFVKKIVQTKDRQKAIKSLFSENLSDTAIVEDKVLSKNWQIGESTILDYKENKVSIDTKNNGDGFLILTDTFYPSWKARIDGRQTRIYRSDFNFRGIVVPKGKHKIEFFNSLF